MYHKIFITNLPSFYKINLYNRINEQKKILVLFTGDTASVRASDFFNQSMSFDYVDLSQMSKIKRIISAISIIKSHKYGELVISGVAELVYWVCVMVFPKSKNATVCESSYLESTTTGLKGWLKKIYHSRISTCYASGAAQVKLIQMQAPHEKIIITKGVGVFNYIAQPAYTARAKVEKFIYVGRLSPEKNLPLLIEAFNELPEYTLNIIGYGPQEADLKAMANPNIVFLGAVHNKDLRDYYQSNDVFVLPSLSEPWGLVVEEALNNGLPVIVSDRVGCSEEIIDETNGLVFHSGDSDSLKRMITKISNIDYYNKLRLNISNLNFDTIETYQVNCYL